MIRVALALLVALAWWPGNAWAREWMFDVTLDGLSIGTHRFVLILPFGEGEVRVELDPKDYAALTREMVRFWNEQGEAASQPPVPLKEDEA